MKNSNIFSLLKTKKSELSNAPSEVISFSTYFQECNLSKTAKMSTTFDIDAFGCSICLEILVEPITMPCKHRMCKPCSAKNLELTNLHCPFCKKRIGTWCRQVSYFLATNFSKVFNISSCNGLMKGYQVDSSTFHRNFSVLWGTEISVLRPYYRNFCTP